MSSTTPRGPDQDPGPDDTRRDQAETTPLPVTGPASSPQGAHTQGGSPQSSSPQGPPQDAYPQGTSPAGAYSQGSPQGAYPQGAYPQGTPQGAYPPGAYPQGRGYPPGGPPRPPVPAARGGSGLSPVLIGVLAGVLGLVLGLAMGFGIGFLAGSALDDAGHMDGGIGRWWDGGDQMNPPWSDQDDQPGRSGGGS